MQIIAIIPARYASTRFPGKPLVDIQGKSMIQRVYEQACKSKLVNRVIIATDDHRIFKHALEFGAEVQMTQLHHLSGTDRVAEVANTIDEADVILNIQGDEPFIDPQQIDQLALFLKNKTSFPIATLAKKMKYSPAIFDPNVVKVVFDINQKALYFSRASIPHHRGQDAENWLKENTIYKHIGLYGFRPNVLLELSKLKPSSLELAESLEQLRWLENGYSIGVEITSFESISIDHPADLDLLSSD